MPELMELIESYDQQAASVRSLFGGEGVKARGRAEAQFGPERILETMRFMDEIYSGRRPLSLLQEALTTSDFPVLFADVIDRQLLGEYTEIAATWQNWLRRGTVRDFRNAKRFAVDGAEGVLAQVDEREEYPEEAVAETADTVRVYKHGKRIDISWEAMINDDLDAFRTLPGRLARSARRTEQLRATQQYVDANGPHASLYNSDPNTINNVVPGNPPLTIEGLQAGMLMLANMKDVDGQPIIFDSVELVVPPALEVKAENILNATELQIGNIQDATRAVMVTNNWVRNRTRLNIDHYIPYVVTGAPTVANSCWFLFATPQGGRTAAELTFLRGEETPALYERMPNARRVGGGGEAMESFEDDSRAWRVRHVLGGARFTNTGGWRATVASKGNGPVAS